jgi:hypothetical protein
MSRDDLELVRGSGNVFRDFGDPNVEPEQTRALLAAKIIRVLDDRKLSVRAAREATGVYTAATAPGVAPLPGRGRMSNCAGSSCAISMGT